MAALPNAPALRVVGRDDTQAQDQVRDAARAQSYAPPSQSPPQGLAGFITDQYTMMRRHRDTVGRGWSDRLLGALRAFDGVYEPNVIEEIKKFGGSNVYARIIAMKCRGTTSLLRDVYIGTDRPWGIEPASDPEVPSEIMQAIGQLLSQEVQQAVQAHFQAAQANAAHNFATQATHALAQAGFPDASGNQTQQPQHPAFVDQSIPSHQSGPSQGMHTGAIPPNTQAGPGTQFVGPGAGMPPPPPIPPLPDPSQLRLRYNDLVEAARDQAKRKAADQAKVSEDKIQERLLQGGFYTALAEFLVDLPLFPYACMKGPVVRIKTQVKWTRDQLPWSGQPQATPQNPIPNSPFDNKSGIPDLSQSNMLALPGMGDMTGGNNGSSLNPALPTSPTQIPGSAGGGLSFNSGPPSASLGGQNNSKSKSTSLAQAQVEDVPVLCWERVSPFDIYWTPGVSDIADANIIQRSRLTRADINDLLDLPGFITDEVRAVLDEYGRGGLVDNWDQTDAERAILESREDPRFNQSGLIACLEFQGMAQGRYLIDMGMDERLIPDPLRDYFCNAWLIGRHIIKVQLSPSPRKRHQYYITSFEKVPGNPSGNGLPDLLADIQSVANATLRALVNNLSISSGPQVTVNDDRLSDGENGEELYPWKRWHVKSDPFGNNTEKAIEFFSPASNSQELLQVYMAFSNLADEHSAIPKFMTGSPPQGGLGRTASGLSMLMQNSSKILQTVAANIDRDVISPILNALYDMIMLTDDTGILTGEEKIAVMGVQVAQQRETQRARQLEFLQITANPIDMSIIGPKGRAQVLRNVATEIGLPGENIVPSDQQLDEQQKQAAAMAQQQQQVGHAMAPPPGKGGGQGGPPPGSPPNQPGQQAPAPTGEVTPRVNTVNVGGPTR